MTLKLLESLQSLKIKVTSLMFLIIDRSQLYLT